MPLKQWPEAKSQTVSYDELVPPAVAVIRQGYQLTRVKDAKLTYDGYTLSTMALAVSANPEEALTEDCLAYHAERGRDLLDVMAGILFNLGLEQGQRCAQEAIQWQIRDAQHATHIAQRKGWVEGVEAVLAAMEDPIWDSRAEKLEKLRAQHVKEKDSIDVIEGRRPLDDVEKALARERTRDTLARKEALVRKDKP